MASSGSGRSSGADSEQWQGLPGSQSVARGQQIGRSGTGDGRSQGGRSAGAAGAGSASQNWLWSSRYDSSGVEGAASLRNPRRLSQGSASSTSQRFMEMLQPFQARPQDFVLVEKEPSVSSMEHWRQMALVRNAMRRFRYVANLESRSQKFSPGQLGMALAAAGRFKLGLPEGGVDESVAEAQAAGFGLGASELERMVQGADAGALLAYQGVQGVALAVGVPDTAKGIDPSTEELERRSRVYGTNTFPEKPFKGFLSFVWDAMQDFTLNILAVCAVVSLVVGIATEGLQGASDGLGILLSILLVVMVTATSDYRQALQFIALDAEKKKVFIPVIRGGQREKLSIYDLVVGDVVVLSIGDIIPADGILVTASSLVVDESSMTGESHPVRKSAGEQPFVLAGTKVQDGTATLLVTGVGMRTEWGHLMAKLSEEGDDETPLQVRLNGVATLVGRLGVYVALLVFIVLMVRLWLDKNAWADWPVLLNRVVNNFAMAVTIIVVAVPEGLPLAVTLSLAFAMKKMMADKALVRKLAACETMGSATTICSDKTGTLTANHMTAVRMWLHSSIMDVSAAQLKLGLPSPCQGLLVEAVFMNTGGDVRMDTLTNAILEIQGTPTESALLGLGLRLGARFVDVRAQSDVVKVEPFNSGRKRMGVALRLPPPADDPATAKPASSPFQLPFSSSTNSSTGSNSAPRFRVHWKGAAEIIVGMCTTVLTPGGQALPLKIEDMEPVLSSFTEDALRTLGFAFLDLDAAQVPPPLLKGEPWPEDVPLPSAGLTLLALVGIQDPLRPAVPGAVALCKSAGIKVRMVTGDNLSTAKAIARGCGILTQDGVAVEGPEFRKMTPDEMREIIPKLQVMARSSPSDKLTLVHELKAMGEVVAVTGDGTNDAPALKESDIGLAMGIAGTEVAKESADIIILDDNFASIVNVARWGRSVYTNIQKFVQFQLTVNIVALTVNFVTACVTGDAPLTTVQLLWVNLIMDTLGALALATEPPTDELMQHQPVGRFAPFITNIMWRNLLGQAFFQLVLLLGLPYFGAPLFGLDKASLADGKAMDTIIFNTFVYCQVFNEINSRHMEKINVLQGMFQNSTFMGIIIFTALFQVVLVQFLSTFVSTVPLTLEQYLICIGLGFISMPVGALIKLIPVPKDRRIAIGLEETLRATGAAPEENEGGLQEPLLNGGSSQPA